uniref:Uncharacterized protein n=1 Tax=Arundo donax TaxID=35708 RepID=A0A0A9FCU8_ARUDO
MWMVISNTVPTYRNKRNKDNTDHTRKGQKLNTWRHLVCSIYK